MNQLNGSNFIQKLKNKKQNKIEKALKQEINITGYKEPNIQQQYVLEIIKGFYEVNDIGKLIWACGLGKALLSILIVKLLGFESVVFGVPSNYLQKQIKTEILKTRPLGQRIHMWA